MFTQKDIHEALGIIWTEKEKKNDSVENIKELFLKEYPDKCEISTNQRKGIYEQLITNNLIVERNGKVEFTQEGKNQASHIIRLQRLAERLLHDVLEIHGEELQQSACEFEHILSEEVEESICTLLGHPKLCPHGLAIPSGSCCRKAITEAKPIITTIDKLDVGEEAKISYIYTHDHSLLHKLLSLGLTPGTTIKLHQRSPTLIVIIGNTTLAIEETVGKNIFIRRK